MIDNEQCYFWLKWIVEVAKADHDGYCTDSYNKEEVHNIIRYFQYEVNEDEYYTIIWMNNECPEMFQNKYFIKAVKPLITKTPIDHDGSDYCNHSVINALSHEIQRKPIKILDFNINNIKTHRKKFIVNSLKIKQYLQIIISKK